MATSLAGAVVRNRTSPFSNANPYRDRSDARAPSATLISVRPPTSTAIRSAPDPSRPARGRQRARILIVDDQSMVREAIASLLEHSFDYDVVEVSGAHDAYAALAGGGFDLILLDVRMPAVDGIQTLRALRSGDCRVPVVMLSSFDSGSEIRGALEAGANGYVVKSADPYQLKEAIETALSHEGTYIHPMAQRSLLKQRHSPEGLGRLTPREAAILQRLCDGSTNEQIALALRISRKTVKAHLSSVFRKLDVRNRTEAVAMAIRGDLAAHRADPRAD